MGTLTPLLKYRNLDLSSDLNRRTTAYAPKGIFSGGNILPISGQLKVNVDAFMAVGYDGMVTSHTGTTQLNVTAGITQYIILRAVYRQNTAPSLQLEVMTPAAYGADPDLTYLIRLGTITLSGGATEVLNANIDYSSADYYDKLGRDFVRGAVATVGDLTTLISAPTRVRVGDIYLVVATKLFYRYSGTSWDPVGSGGLSFGATPVKIIPGVSPANGSDPGAPHADHQHGIDFASNSVDGAISAEVYAAQESEAINGVVSGLTVSGTSLSLPYTSGALISNMVQYAITGSSILLADNATNYVYFDSGTGLIAVSTAFATANAANNILIAQAVTSAGSVTSLTDLRKFAFKAANKGVLVVNPSSSLGHFTSLDSAVAWLKLMQSNSVSVPGEVLITGSVALSATLDFTGLNDVAIRSNAAGNDATTVTNKITWSFSGAAINPGSSKNVTLDGLYFEYSGTIAGGSVVRATSTVSPAGWTVRNCYAKAAVGALHSFIFLDSASSTFHNLTVENNTAFISWAAVTVPGESTNMKIRGNTVYGHGNPLAPLISLYGFFVNVSNSVISDNIVLPDTFNVGAFGVVRGTSDVTISNNVYFCNFVGSLAEPILEIGNTAHQKVNITGNVFISSGLNASGINLNASTEVVVSNNSIILSSTTTTNAYGVSGSGNNVIVDGNHISVQGIGGTLVAGVLLSGSSSGKVGDNNILMNSSATTATGISVSNSYSTVTGNIIRTCGGAANLSGSISFGGRYISISDNIVIGGRGVVSTLVSGVSDTKITVSGNVLYCVYDNVYFTSNTIGTVVDGNAIIAVQVDASSDCVTLYKNTVFSNNYVYYSQSGVLPGSKKVINVPSGSDGCIVDSNVFMCDGGGGASDTYTVVYINSSNSVSVIKNRIRCIGSCAYAVYFTGVVQTNITIEDNIVDSDGDMTYGFYSTGGMENSSISGNKLKGYITECAIYAYTVRKCKIDRNSLQITASNTAASADAIGIMLIGFMVDSMNTLNGNTVICTGKSGTHLRLVRVQESGKTTVVGNNFYWNLASVGDGSGPYYVVDTIGTNTEGITFSGNVLTIETGGSIGTGSAVDGICLQAGKYASIVGNYFNSSCRTANVDRGCVILTLAEDNTVSGNVCRNLSGSARGTGIYVGPSGGVSAITGNRVTGHLYGIYIHSSAAAGTVVGNVNTGCSTPVQNNPPWAAAANNI